MAGESEDSEVFGLMRLIINLGALAISVAIVALVVATVVVELD